MHWGDHLLIGARENVVRPSYWSSDRSGSLILGVLPVDCTNMSVSEVLVDLIHLGVSTELP